MFEHITFIYPFSWIHKYSIACASYYIWNIIVPKIFKLFIKILKAPNIIKSLVFFDGPDFHSKPYVVDTKTTFKASTFQISIFYAKQPDTINLLFEKYRIINISGRHRIYNISAKVILNSIHMALADSKTVFSVQKLNAFEGTFVNITLLSIKYSGPNVGYCKYGGLSVYEKVNSTFKEVYLSCHDIFSTSIKSMHNNMIISSTESLFLIFYAYKPYSKIKVHVRVESTICQGVHVLRYFFSNLFHLIIYLFLSY